MTLSVPAGAMLPCSFCHATSRLAHHCMLSNKRVFGVWVSMTRSGIVSPDNSTILTHGCLACVSCPQALVLLLVEEDEALAAAGWKALEALAATVPKDEQADHVDALKEAVATAREKERRKRKSGPLRIGGLCSQPRALAPLLPFYLQGVLQVGKAASRPVCAGTRVFGGVLVLCCRLYAQAC